MAESPPNGIVYFHYARSPYGKRVAAYLAFRRIAYADCIQPPVMPRPDLSALGIQYRRTPSMAIGRDVYIDSRLIISRLEQLFPASEQHPGFSTPETKGLAALLNKLTIDANIFTNAVSMLPGDAPAWQSEEFIKDRAGFYGKEWTMFDARDARPQGTVHVRECFDILEALFVDGRTWVGGTEMPTLADLEGVWSIDWIVTTMSPPEALFGEDIYPKVYGWRARYNAALDEARAMAPKVVSLEGSNAVAAILDADYTDESLVVDPHDPITLFTSIREGSDVELFPTDGGGFTHKDRGRLIKLNKNEVAISIASRRGEEIHLHAPRWGFMLSEMKD